MSAVSRWWIFYGDGSFFSSEDGAPADAPGGNVQVVAVEDENVGVFLHRGVDFYVYDEELFDGWMGVDYFGFIQYLVRPGVKIIKLGENMPYQGYKALMTKLQKFGPSDLPAKSARYEEEGHS